MKRITIEPSPIVSHILCISNFISNFKICQSLGGIFYIIPVIVLLLTLSALKFLHRNNYGVHRFHSHFANYCCSSQIYTAFSMNLIRSGFRLIYRIIRF